MIFGEEATLASAGFHASPLSWLNWNNFGDVGFCGGRKTGEPREKLLEQGENQQQTQPTYGTRPELNAGHISGRCHSCFPEERKRGDCNLKRLC